MKKLLILLLTFIFISSMQVFAEIIPHCIYVVTTEDISNKTIKTNQELELFVLDSYEADDGLCLKENEKITVKILDYVKPKRGKRNGYYKIRYTVNRSTYMEGTMRTATVKDLNDIAKKAGIAIVGHILKVPGFSQAIAFSKGLINPNEDESRLKSAGKNLYESTPLTYVEKGEDFAAEKDSIILLRLKYAAD
ncbi:MAG: hypothetical protein LUG16_08955 [Candidatus Gastranaerophilales bacterium]|nr:hypothetical protein [Candidatus Gastranaerophilales bacterium]